VNFYLKLGIWVAVVGAAFLFLWRGGYLLRTLDGHENDVLAVAFSPNGKTLVSGGGKSLTLWDVQSGMLIGILEGHSRSICTVAFSSNGKMLVSGSEDTDLKLWDVSDLT
jgi:hypothetical protein